ncbi:hypothetical protein BQ8794_30106 [Mesorhizobium prunaredense]|uniref:Uncharacterized protein n=1 Tax=Mesorhizobium prunaredense TaxID=1631249 RepID=A0A1R3V9Q9_9HYPH|nr:hypothetical protein BQ8794_30106 [Mesorhizobium prunaredense]
MGVSSTEGERTTAAGSFFDPNLRHRLLQPDRSKVIGLMQDSSALRSLAEHWFVGAIATN